MRLEELTLERYGHFQDFRLSLEGAGTRLHVIFGPNEAGKSTLLEAISDLLFGFPPRTRYGFLCGYDNLLIGATLSNRAGDRLSIRRRKRQRNTLLDPQGGVLPETALKPFLGSLDRKVFEQEFGLDHYRLRQGGDQMLAAKGDLAHSLFQASGLSDVTKIQDALKTATDELWSPQRKVASKPLWGAIEDYNEAKQRMRREALRVDEWDQAERAETEATAALAACKSALETLRRERNRLQRLRDALPALARLDALTERWAPLADAPELPADFADHWRKAVSREAIATAEVQRLSDERLTLETALRDWPAPSRLPDHAHRIESLFRQSGDLAAKHGDHPKLLRDLEHSDGRLAQLILQLGGPFTLANLEQHRPSKPMVARIRERIGQWGALDAELTAKTEQAAAAHSQLQETEQEQATLGQPIDPAGAKAALDEALKAGDLETRLAAAERVAGQAAAAAATAFARLGGGWAGSQDALSATPFPSRETVETVYRTGQSLDAERQRRQDDRDKAQTGLCRFEASVRQLEAGTEVPTPEALQEARRHRERGWRLVRGGYIDQTLEIAQAAVDYAPETGDLPTAYEDAVRRADDLVDRAKLEADQVARYLALQTQTTEARQTVMQCEAALVDLDRRIAEHQAQWAALWRHSGVTPTAPIEMLAWLQRKDEAIQAAHHQLKAEDDVAGLRQQAEILRGLLQQAGALLGQTDLDNLPSTALRHTIKAAVDQASRTWNEASRLREDQRKHRRALEKADAALAETHRRRQAWSLAWTEDMPALGLPGTATPIEAEVALKTWQTIEEELVDRRQRHERLQGIEEDLAAGREDVLSLIEAIGESLPTESAPRSSSLFNDPLLDLPQRLHDRLKADQQALIHRNTLSSRVADLGDALARAQRSQEQARQALLVLRSAHGLSATVDPLQEAERATQRRALIEPLAEARHRVETLAAGQDEAKLRDTLRGEDADALGARAQAVDDDEQRLHQDLEDASKAALLAHQQREALRQRAGIQEAAQQERDTKRHAANLANRWVRLWAAQALLGAAIQRFRNANEHPLVKCASTLFALIAGAGHNPIERLSVEYGDKDHPVLMGIRRDNSRCPVEGMSDGTRDQLYLALRIAAVESAAIQGEPMPFIADDLFITSDDERTSPGLRALAELGRETQVLLFTHHRSVVDTALSVVGAEGLRIHELSR